MVTKRELQIEERIGREYIANEMPWQAGLPKPTADLTDRGSVASLIAQYLWQQPQFEGAMLGTEDNARRQVRRALELLGTPEDKAMDVEVELSKNNETWWQWVILSASRILDAMCLASQYDFECETQTINRPETGDSLWFITIKYENPKAKRNCQEYMVFTPAN